MGSTPPLIRPSDLAGERTYQTVSAEVPVTCFLIGWAMLTVCFTPDPRDTEPSEGIIDIGRLRTVRCSGGLQRKMHALDSSCLCLPVISLGLVSITHR